MNKDPISDKNNISDNRNTLLQSLKTYINDVSVIPVDFSLKPSPFMNIDDLFSLAKLTNLYLEKENVDGVVITHGTDTLEESAFFLNLVKKTHKPVVFTGSMRSFSELGYDGLSNVISSILVAAHEDSYYQDTLVVFNDSINSATEVTKTHTLSLDTFKSLEFGPLGIIDEKRVIYYRKKISTENKFNLINKNKRVEIVKCYIDSNSDILNFLIDSNIDGIVIEALGRGNVPPNMVDGIVRAIENNIPVVLVSRAPMGRVVDSYGYIGGGAHLRSLGVIFATNLNAAKARILLLLLVNNSSDNEKINLIDFIY